MENKTVPDFNYSVSPALAEFGVSKQEWLRSNDKHFDGLATSALVYDPEGRVLLLKRAAHDSMPNRWEPPGGSVDDEDPSILFGCTRELWEEAGLTAAQVVGKVGEGYAFTNRTGKMVFWRFPFMVVVGQGVDVKTDPNEHSAFRWATEEEVRMERGVDGEDMPLAGERTKSLLLEAFSMKREEAGE